MIPFAVAVLLLDVAAVTRHTAGGSITVLRWLGFAGSAAFYTLLIWSYLRRRPAVATSGSHTGHACAVVATILPFVLPLTYGTPPGPGRQIAADALVAAGLAWSVWAIRFLGPNFSVLPQAPGRCQRGPLSLAAAPALRGRDRGRARASGRRVVACGRRTGQRCARFRRIARYARNRSCFSPCPDTVPTAPAPPRCCRASSNPGCARNAGGVRVSVKQCGTWR